MLKFAIYVTMKLTILQWFNLSNEWFDLRHSSIEKVSRRTWCAFVISKHFRYWNWVVLAFSAQKSLTITTTGYKVRWWFSFENSLWSHKIYSTIPVAIITVLNVNVIAVILIKLSVRVLLTFPKQTTLFGKNLMWHNKSVVRTVKATSSWCDCLRKRNGVINIWRKLD